jgi:RimJ/RimL family protein N-acetyltransferase
MKFRKSVKSDIKHIINLIEQGKIYFQENNIPQWQNNYPNIEIISNDIMKENSYILVKNKKIIGTVTISFDEEKTYNYIDNGNWLSSGKYAVIHRIAINPDHKGLGLGSIIIQNIEKICLSKDIHSIKIDTHAKNISMQKLLLKNNFKHCGTIYLERKSPRMAFEKIF